MYKLLFITTQLPYPPFSGGVIKTWKMVEFFSKNYQFSLACLLKNNDKEHEPEFLEKITLDNYYSEELNIARSARNLLNSYIQGKPLNVYRNQSKTFAKKVEELSQNADFIFVDHYEMFQFVPNSFTGKVIFHEHNAEFLLWKRFSEENSGYAKKKVLKQEAKRVLKTEKTGIKKSDLVFAAPKDIENLIEEGAESEKFEPTYHLGDDTMLQMPDIKFEETEKSIFYVGTLSWEPNIIGLLWFIENCWDLVLEKDSDIKLYIVGKDPDARLKKAGNSKKNIIFEGFKKDLEPYYSKCRIYIAPLTFGSGIKVKVLNAMYRGIPVVTTEIGAESLTLENKKHLLIENSEENYAEAILSLMNNKSLWEVLSRNSREIAKNKYTWDSLLGKMNDKIINLL